MAPQAFDECVRRGGRIRTKKLKEDRYVHVCFIDGKNVAGEVKQKQKKGALDKIK